MPPRSSPPAAQPLPVVGARVNGALANLVLDTGAGDLVLDEQFAVTAGVRLGECELRRFAGGLAAPVRYGHAATLGLGAVTVRHLLVQMLPLNSFFLPFFPDLPIYGILGTSVFSRFSTTLDYRTGRLRLAPLVDSPRAGDRVRFWIAGSHYIVVGGRLSEGSESLLFLDTGLTGAAFAIPRAGGDANGIWPISDTAQMGAGGGGQVEGRPVRLGKVCLGPVSRSEAEGIMLEAFPLERQFGFRIGGLIAHDFFRRSVLTLNFGTMSLTVD